MNNFIKAAIGCTAALVMTAACGKEFVNERTVEEDQKTCALEYRSYETEGTVVFHDYVPKQKEADVYGGSVPYTIWTPTVIIECCGMRKRLCDQESYEAYRMDEVVTVMVTDGLDPVGNVVECDFKIIGKKVENVQRETGR